MSVNDRNLTDLTELTAGASSDWLYTVRPGVPNLPRKIRAGNLLGNLLGFSWINVKAPAYGAVGDDVADDTAAIQAALDAVDATYGGVVYFPRPSVAYKISSTLTLKVRTTLMGDGMVTSRIHYTGVGNAILSSWTPNSSNAVWISLRSLGVYTDNAANAGGGFVDIAGSYILLDECLFQGFKHQVIFDQTEHGVINRSYMNLTAAISRSGLWLVNGDDNTGGNSQFYTNSISVYDTQFNGDGSGATAYHVRDDGGVNHSFFGNNFNGGGSIAYACYFAAVRALNIEGSASESHITGSYLFDESTSLGADYVGPCTGVNIEGNSFSDAAAEHLKFNAGYGIRIASNLHAAYTTSAINVNSDKVRIDSIIGNAKLMIGAARTGKGYINPALSAQRFGALGYAQHAQTYVASSLTAGTVTVTPVSMGYPGGMDEILVGSKLYAVNADGTNGEVVTPSAVAATTFTAVFASNKAANWLVLGVDDMPLRTFNATLGNESQRISSQAASGDNPQERVFTNKVLTTDATVTTIHTVQVPATTTVLIDAKFIARRTGGVAGTAEDGAAYYLTGAYKNVAGTATVIGAVAGLLNAEDQAGWAATFAVSGATVLLRVTGAVNNNVSWTIVVRTYPLST